MSSPLRRTTSFATAIEARADTDPDAELVRLVDAPGWSAGRLSARGTHIAQGLARVVAQGDAVATCLPAGPEAVATTVALSRLGAVEVPLVPDVPEAWARKLTRAVSCATVIAPCGLIGRRPMLRHLGRHERHPLIAQDAPGSGAASLDELCETPARVPSYEPSLSDPAVVMSTSGTTGRPKGALLPNGAGLAQAERVIRAMGYGVDDVLYNFFPWQHINARHAGFLAAVLSGGRMVIGPRFEASRFIDVCRANEVTAFNFMGAVCALLLRQPPAPDDREHGISRAYGGPAPAEMVAAVQQRFGISLLQAYACTELADVATSRLDDNRPGATGRPVPEYDVRVVDTTGREVTTDAVGELLVRPTRPHLTFTGYVGEPEATVHAWRDGWFHTGDRVRLSEGWLWFEERSADVIRRRGHNISAAELESVVAGMPGVADVAVVGVPSELTEEEVLVHVVPDPETTLDPAEVREHCRSRIPRYALPRYVHLTDEIPRNASLKVLRSALRASGLPADAWDAETQPSLAGGPIPHQTRPERP